jgi:hypothetical protein
MAISTSSIFHFTQSFDILKSILSEGFKVTYCLEEYIIGNGTVGLGVAMVSFADIPLSQLNQSVSNYGHYCIGLSKKWASSNHINPVLYMEQNSYLSQIFCNYLELIESNPNLHIKYEMTTMGDGKVNIKNIQTPEKEIALNMMNGLLTFIKNSNGTLVRKDKAEINNFNFYAEREWRYIPSEEDLINARFLTDIIMPKEDYNVWRSKSDQKEFFPRLALKFNVNDIAHIIVDTDYEIPTIIDHIKSETNLFSNQGELELLLTKITSFEKLIKDF